MQSSVGQLTLLFSMFAYELPMLLVCVIAIGLLLTRRQQRSPALPWALMGFGLALFLCFALPIGQWAMQNWIMSSGAAASSRASVYGVVSIFWSILHALSYGLLAIAILVGSSQRHSGSSASLPSRP
jgi:hypothetical protein